MRGPNPEKLRPRGVGPRRVVGGGGGRGASSRGNSVGYRQILSQLVEVKGLQSIAKNMLLTFWKVKHCKGGRGGCSTVGGPKAAKSTSSSKQRQQQAATGTQATRKSSNQQQNQEQHKQHKQQPRKSEGEVWVPKVQGVRGASSRGILVVFEAFFLDTIKICNNWSLTFSEVLWGADQLQNCS